MAALTLTAVPFDHVTGNTELAAAITGTRFEVVGYVISSDGTDRVKLRSGTTVITALEMIAGSVAVLPPGDHRLYGVSGSNLNILTVGAANVSGHVLIRGQPL